MPSVQTSFGPLVEPGWPSTLPGQPDISKNFLSGFQLAATVKGKQLALQNQLANYSLKMQQMQNEDEMSKAKYELAVARLASSNDIARERLDFQRDRASTLADFAMQRENRLQSVIDDKVKTKAESEDASFNLNLLPSQLAEEGYQKGTNEYYNQWRARAAPDLSKLPTSLRKSAEANALKEYKDSRDFQLKMLESDEKAFAHDYGRVVQSGDDLNINLAPMLHPETLEPETTGWFWDKKKTGKVVVGTTPEGKPRTTTMDELNKFKTRYQSIQKRRETIGPDPDRPDLGLPAKTHPDNRIIEKTGPDGVTHHFEVNDATRTTVRQID
jgi:hypothetical protein